MTRLIYEGNVSEVVSSYTRFTDRSISEIRVVVLLQNGINMLQNWPLGPHR